MFHHPALQEQEHRPWPMPASPWMGQQSWCDLLFAHWPVDAAALRPHIPAGLTLQEFDGTAWLGLVPFRMAAVRARFLPPLPGLSAFPELNVRTYVEQGGKPGVWFFSLDAAHHIAVWAARRWYCLPYYFADMTIGDVRGGVEYLSRRRTRRTEPERRPAAEFKATYGPSGDVYRADPGTLEHWVTERYCLYAAAPSGRLFRAEVHHVPWPLQPAEAEISVNTMSSPLGVEIPAAKPLLHFVKRIDVVVWTPQACAGTRADRPSQVVPSPAAAG